MAITNFVVVVCDYFPIYGLKFKLSVHLISHLMAVLLLHTVSPNITRPVEGQEFTITEGSDGSITCTATGYPPPTVVWKDSDGSSLSNMRLVSGSEVMSSTGVGNVTSVSVELMVTGAMRVDTGMYTCSASNIVSFNDTYITVTITIQCKYDIISIVFCVPLKTTQEPVT